MDDRWNVLVGTWIEWSVGWIGLGDWGGLSEAWLRLLSLGLLPETVANATASSRTTPPQLVITNSADNTR